MNYKKIHTWVDAVSLTYDARQTVKDDLRHAGSVAQVQLNAADSIRDKGVDTRQQWNSASAASTWSSCETTAVV